MKVTRFLAVILIAATTASAQPPEERGERVPFHTHERHRPRRDHDWVRLATPTPTRHGTEYIVVGRDAGWFRTLRFEVTSGSVVLRSVRVLSPDRLQRTYYVGRKLDRRDPVLFLDLGASGRIDQLVVVTDRYPRGSYTVYGSSGRAQPRNTDVAMR